MKNFRTKNIFGVIIVGMLALVIIFELFSGFKALNGNKDLLKVDYNFKKTIIKLPNNEIITGDVDEWTTYDNKDTLKVKLKNGKQYLGHSSNIILYND
jgi:hypothetical protein